MNNFTSMSEICTVQEYICIDKQEVLSFLYIFHSIHTVIGQYCRLFGMVENETQNVMGFK